ncbi:Fanconi anemia group E protein isoform X2 [Gadus chalcogrammus]|uniref:Fanconi anemia group E protein isoform X2 n=1 Tax=Gadus chalcogrammus TaxID=1042646 RepID=UPI0024C3D24D|nr:Fanconi anemia group E protein isoform X2 [Gadus chalcogrammus]
MDGLTARLTGKDKLLVLALMSGTSGARRALCVFEKQQRYDLKLSLSTFLEMLCQKAISPENLSEPILPRPLVCLFPVAFKRNLLSFLRLVNQVLPQTRVVQLLECLSKDPRQDHWVTALIGQLQRDMGSLRDVPLYTASCSQRLKRISERLKVTGRNEGWAKYFTEPKLTSQSGGDVLEKQKKRKSSSMTPDTEVESTQQHKRMKMDMSSVEERLGAYPHGSFTSEEPVLMERGECDPPKVESGGPSTSNLWDNLPENIKAFVPQIKELLGCQSEWDQGSTDVFKVLNECDSAQVELLCGMLNLADTPEETLPKLCSCLLALSPELSYSAASAVIKSLLLGKILCLLEPASRSLVAAVTSLSSQYPRAACHALIRPILQEENLGTQQAELINRLIGDCLEPHYNLLVFQMTFTIVWSESMLSIIHSLLDSKLDIDEKHFSSFIAQLVSQAPQFIKSMKYAKMMLTVLTKYSIHVTASHKPSLSHCLMLNQTFLKKSLQSALKRITHK